MPRSFAAGTSLFVLALMLLAGCTPAEPPPPATFQVVGKVVQKDGTPYTGKGQIEFRSVNTPAHMSFGEIGDDGSFKLKTIAGNRAVDGATEGEHQVSVMVPVQGGKSVRAQHLKTTYAIKAGDNDITVKLEK